MALYRWAAIVGKWIRDMTVLRLNVGSITYNLFDLGQINSAFGISFFSYKIKIVSPRSLGCCLVY